MNWFAVDKEGLAKLADRRGKVFVIHELLQNAWDTGCKMVSVSLEPMPNRPLARLVVTDDHPNGFANLSHAYTLFAESEKKADRSKRGRFNLGEKLILSLCEEAEITSTKGRIAFDRHGRKETRHKTERGTTFEALIRMTREELDQALVDVQAVLPPTSCETVVNGVSIGLRHPLRTLNSFLKTEISDERGVLRVRYEEVAVDLLRIRSGERAFIYEMGIPIQELGDDPYHVNVHQKIPLTMERDAVPPSYLKDIRTCVLDAMAKDLSGEELSRKWANEALEEAGEEAVKTAISKRFGDAVIADPSDREAENIAKAKGYAVIAGGTFSGDAWENIKKAGALRPAGQVTPSPKPFSADGSPLKLITSPSEEMEAFATLARHVAKAVPMPIPIVVFTNDVTWGFAAAYSRSPFGGPGVLTVNAGRLGRDFFKTGKLREQLELIIHELGHHFGHHLEESYHDALCRIGAALAVGVGRVQKNEEVKP